MQGTLTKIKHDKRFRNFLCFFVSSGDDFCVTLVEEDKECDAADDGLRNDVTRRDDRLLRKVQEAPVHSKSMSTNISRMILKMF
jgi:hypothetical protein